MQVLGGHLVDVPRIVLTAKGVAARVTYMLPYLGGANKVATAVLRLELGNTSNVKWMGAFGEYRIDWGPGYRIYLAKDGDALIVLFGGGTKKGQQSDIARAKVLWTEYRTRKSAAAGRGRPSRDRK